MFWVALIVLPGAASSYILVLHLRLACSKAHLPQVCRAQVSSHSELRHVKKSKACEHGSCYNLTFDKKKAYGGQVTCRQDHTGSR